ncbi:hypothetical protein NBT05_17365 [Aquimarina sp. ERC-38]|uniref:hypothetical protein n=1 Tax=Aquimarina sp. ERC-38 TaxID=2949996 RepID=UPI002246A3F8|nr:hypothetical protein [Aquimarina sp. ERC-38]UZO80698.1 hypothetical protein NBT05_17365 [Aquimarina sp. ERC-38]
MTSPINIHSLHTEIELSYGIYSVKVLGGLGVKVGNFSFDLRNVDNSEIIKPKKTRWRVQSFAFKKRAKKIFTLDVENRGNFLIVFKHQTDLKVRRSNLFLTRLFENELLNEKLEI